MASSSPKARVSRLVERASHEQLLKRFMDQEKTLTFRLLTGSRFSLPVRDLKAYHTILQSIFLKDLSPDKIQDQLNMIKWVCF